MKSKVLLSAVLLLAAAGCDKNPDVSAFPDGGYMSGEVGHDMIVLGDRLDDPYSVKNVTKAIESLYPTKAGHVELTPTDKYVRFLPSSESEFESLQLLGLDLVDHPLDYQIVKDGDYYHDPELEDDRITWQYAVVDKDFEMPSWVRHELIDECYIPATDVRSDDGIDWAEVEREAFRLTGNEAMIRPLSKATSGNPAGRITIVDDKANGGKPYGVAGVKVVTNVFVKFASAFTDRDGYYSIDTKYAGDVRYRIMFKNQKGFAIGFNMLLVPASCSALGKASAEGLDVVIDSSSDRKLFCRSVVNNAAYEYLERCAEEDLNIPEPPAKLRLWIFQGISASSAVMLKHGAVVEANLLTKFLGKYVPLLELFLPDITLGLDGSETYSTIYSTTCHEMAHASHFAQVGKSFWNKYILYILSSFVTSGGQTYGTGAGVEAGYCEIGEMWGYFMQNKMYNDRYGGEMPVAGSSYWFHPQIFRYLNERGLSVSMIFKALDSDVHDRDVLKDRLISLYPEKQQIIEQVFDRYLL